MKSQLLFAKLNEKLNEQSIVNNCLVMKMAMLIPIVNFLLSKAQLYLPGITLSAKDNEKLFKLLMEESEISVYWNEVKTKSTSNNTKN